MCKIDATSSPLKESDGQSPLQMTMDEIVAAIHSTEPNRQFSGMQAASNMLSREHNPPIDIMIGHGIVPICVIFLQNFENGLLQFEAAWILTYIACGTAEQRRCVIENNGVPHLIAVLQSLNINLVEQAVWALASIAGDGAAARDIVLQNNVIDGILGLINNETPISLLRNIVWLMSNLCRNTNQSPPLDQIKRILPVLSQLLCGTDNQVLGKVCKALIFVTEDGNSKIQAVVDAGAVPRLVDLLGTDEPDIIAQALRCIGNIVTGTEQQTDAVIAADVLPKLGILLQHSHIIIVMQAAWTISNITAGNKNQIQAVIDADIFAHIRKVLEKGYFISQKEAAWAVTNTTTYGTPEQISDLIEKYQILKPFYDLLNAKDPHTIWIVLTGISNILDAAEILGDTKKICVLVEEMGGLDKLESLQYHENEEVCEKAFAIVGAYFSTGDGAL